MKLNAFIEMLDSDDFLRTDYIVRLKYKYDWEKDYTISNEYLEYNGNDDNWIWLNDWNEGQTDVEVIGYIDIDDVKVSNNDHLYEFQPDQIKPEFCRIRSVFKSLYHDLLPDLDITLQCSILPDNDMVEVCRRVKNAAYQEYVKIMQEEMEKAHGFPVVGTWMTETGSGLKGR